MRATNYLGAGCIVPPTTPHKPFSTQKKSDHAGTRTCARHARSCETSLGGGDAGGIFVVVAFFYGKD